MAVEWSMGEAFSVQGEQKRGQDCSLWGVPTADNCVWHAVLSPHILWPVGEVVQLQLVPQKCRLYGLESTGEIKEHDPHSAFRLFQMWQWSVQEKDDGVVHSDARLLCKLEWVHKRTHQSVEMDKDQVWSESNCSVAVEVLWVRSLWHWYHAGGIPQHWHSQI